MILQVTIIFLVQIFTSKSKNLQLIALIYSGLQNTVLTQANDFADWSLYTNTAVYTSYCDGINLLGGYQIFDLNKVQQTNSLLIKIPHYKIYYDFTIYLIGSEWSVNPSGNYVSIFMLGESTFDKVTWQSSSNFQSRICNLVSKSTATQAFSQEVSVNTQGLSLLRLWQFQPQAATGSVLSNLDFAIRDFNVYLDNCDYSCKSCTAGLSNNCNLCHSNLFKLVSNSCVCYDGFYLSKVDTCSVIIYLKNQSQQQYTTSKCSYCYICDSNCLTCSSSGICTQCMNSSDTLINGVCTSNSYSTQIHSAFDSSLWTFDKSYTTLTKTCLDLTVYGGYDNFKAGAYMKRTFSALPAHKQLIIQVKAIKIGNPNMVVSFNVDTTSYTVDQTYFEGFYLCGQSSSVNSKIVYVQKTIAHTSSTFDFKLYSDITATKQNWGLISLNIWTQNCETNCEACELSDYKICTQCSSGYYVNSGSCTKCADGQYTLNGVCTSCSSDQYLSNGVCTSCPAGQYVLNGVCTSCSDSQYLLNGVCTSCSSQQYLLNGVCTSCSVGQYLSNGICITCEQPCATCISSTVCQSCLNGYAFNSDKKCVLTDFTDDSQITVLNYVIKYMKYIDLILFLLISFFQPTNYNNCFSYYYQQIISLINNSAIDIGFNTDFLDFTPFNIQNQTFLIILQSKFTQLVLFCLIFVYPFFKLLRNKVKLTKNKLFFHIYYVVVCNFAMSIFYNLFNEITVQNLSIILQPQYNYFLKGLKAIEIVIVVSTLVFILYHYTKYVINQIPEELEILKNINKGRKESLIDLQAIINLFRGKLLELKILRQSISENINFAYISIIMLARLYLMVLVKNYYSQMPQVFYNFLITVFYSVFIVLSSKQLNFLNYSFFLVNETNVFFYQFLQITNFYSFSKEVLVMKYLQMAIIIILQTCFAFFAIIRLINFFIQYHQGNQQIFQFQIQKKEVLFKHIEKDKDQKVQIDIQKTDITQSGTIESSTETEIKFKQKKQMKRLISQFVLQEIQSVDEIKYINDNQIDSNEQDKEKFDGKKINNFYQQQNQQKRQTLKSEVDNQQQLSILKIE